MRMRRKPHEYTAELFMDGCDSNLPESARSNGGFLLNVPFAMADSWIFQLTGRREKV